MSFCHTHRHSEFSRLDGIGTAKQYAQEAAKLGQNALALTDHGTLSGSLHHIEACREAGIAPISGVEAYFRPDRSEKIKESYHLCLFAKNETGWHNLLRIVSVAYGEIEEGGGFYKYPCADYALLEQYSAGIACSTACVSSYLSKLIERGDSSMARSYLDRMLNIYGDDLWVEIMPHDFDEQRTLNKELVRLANERSIPLIATNDAHFPYKEWAETQRVAKIMGVQKSFAQVEKDMEAGKAEYLAELQPTLYLAGETEMFSWFAEHHPDLPYEVVDESLRNTGIFASKFEGFELDKSVKLPKVTESPEESEKILNEWISEGLQNLENLWIEQDGLSTREAYERYQEYRKRVDYEFKVLKDKKILDYFVMVGDICRWAKGQGIRVGLGRGSAAGCLISYLIGITAIDPIAYGLLFERFLNPERKGMPDIDLDFDSEKRQDVKDYVIEKYGADHVADIITHSRFQPKNVLQALGRVYDLPYTEAMEVTNTIEIRADDEDTTLEEILPKNRPLQKFKNNHPDIWEHALRLEGSVSNAGKHAAGIIVTPEPITDYMALERGKGGDLVTSWSDAADFAVISDYGFMKMDFLGITGLTKHEYACKMIEERTGEKVDLNGLKALRDPHAVEENVMDIFREGFTMGVFQFASDGITGLLKSIRPDNILHITAANALYRPGPLEGGATWDYAKRKNGEVEPTFWHEIVTPVLEETFGLIAYQEQVMEIGKRIGGFSGAEADDMRKAMGKLYRIKGGRAAKDFMARFEAKWYAGAKERNIPHAVAKEIWEKLLEFGHYGFVKSHSASYSLHAYQDAWLKANYPGDFYAAQLTYERDNDMVKAIIREARLRGLKIVFPDIYRSDVGYTIDSNGDLVLGLTAIKGLGPANAKDIIENRPFKNFDDLITRCKKLPVRELLEAGALDAICNRAYMLSTVNNPLTKRIAKMIDEGQDRPTRQMWEHYKHNKKLKNPYDIPDSLYMPNPSSLDQLQAQRLNTPVASLLMTDEQKEVIESRIDTPDRLELFTENHQVQVGGEVTAIHRAKSKKGKEYANVRIAFGSHEWTVKFWESQLLRFEHFLVEGNLIMVTGKKNTWKSQLSIVADEVIHVNKLIESLKREAEQVAS